MIKAGLDIGNSKISCVIADYKNIENINILFEKWEPVERFNIEKVSENHTSYNPNSVQYTPEFEEKLKEVLS